MDKMYKSFWPPKVSGRIYVHADKPITVGVSYWARADRADWFRFMWEPGPPARPWMGQKSKPTLAPRSPLSQQKTSHNFSGSASGPDRCIAQNVLMSLLCPGASSLQCIVRHDIRVTKTKSVLLLYFYAKQNMHAFISRRKATCNNWCTWWLHNMTCNFHTFCSKVLKRKKRVRVSPRDTRGSGCQVSVPHQDQLESK